MWYYETCSILELYVAHVQASVVSDHCRIPLR